MAGTFAVDEITYGLEDVWVMSFDIGADTTSPYTGTVGRVAGPQLIEVEHEFDTDVARTSSRKSRAITVKTGARVTLNFLGCDFDVKVIMTGMNLLESGEGSTNANLRRMGYVEAGGTGLPYFGLVASGPTDDGGLFVGGIACLKLDNEGSWRLDGNENKLNTGELTAESLSVKFTQGAASYNVFDVVRTYVSPADFTKPTDAASFRDVFDLLAT